MYLLDLQSKSKSHYGICNSAAFRPFNTDSQKLLLSCSPIQTPSCQQPRPPDTPLKALEEEVFWYQRSLAKSEFTKTNGYLIWCDMKSK